MDWAKARQLAVARAAERDRERAEEDRKKQYNSESPTKIQRKEAKKKKNAANMRKKRADEKAKEESYIDRCKKAGCQYVPPVRKEKAANRVIRHDQMDQQISVRENAKEKEKLRGSTPSLTRSAAFFQRGSLGTLEATIARCSL